MRILSICFILGTRPEIIKLSPLINYCQNKKINHFLIHTFQHYSLEMNEYFMRAFNIAKPAYALDIQSREQAAQTAEMMLKIEPILKREKPKLVLVQGDTNSVLAGALTTSKLPILLGHVEAGLRCFNKHMPEEINRVITDHVSDLLFAPTQEAVRFLKDEGIEKNVFLVGNTIADVVESQKLQYTNNPHLNQELPREKFILVTTHRQETVDNKENLQKLFSALASVKENLGIDVVFPIHPRTEKRANEFGIKKPEKIQFIPPTDYKKFLWLENNAKVIITDSGGVQEEACILRIPCVTIRNETERPETVKLKANIVTGLKPEKILKGVRKMIDINKTWIHPYGDGTAGEKIMKICLEEI